MTEVTAEFFDRLARSGYERRLARADGFVRVDLSDRDRTEHWLIRLEKGHIAVSRRNARADCVVSADRGLFEKIVTGKANAMTAVLRGAMAVEGDPQLAVLFQLLFGRLAGQIDGDSPKP